MDKVKPAVLLMGGGEGMGQLEEIVDAISDAVGSACQVEFYPSFNMHFAAMHCIDQ